MTETKTTPKAKATSTLRQAITTRYLGPTNHHGARIKATAQAGSVTVPYDHELNPEGAHAKAAMALADKWGWGGRWVGGATATGYAFVDVGGAS